VEASSRAYRGRQLGSCSPKGVIGEAGAASRAKGERLIEAAVPI
jgi:creatinine amidohydrolase/Fe(II)-dependent formamide hydrolase-like protein